MITGDSFYSCDDATRAALRVGQIYLPSANAVTIHSYSGFVERNLADSVAESWDFSLTAKPTIGTDPNTSIYYGNLFITVNHFDVPVGTYFMFVAPHAPTSPEYTPRVYYVDSGLNPVADTRPVTIALYGYVTSFVQVQFDLQAGAALNAGVQIQFTGYKISE